MRGRGYDSLSLVVVVATFLGSFVAGCPGKKKADPAAVQKLWEQSKVDEARFGALILNRGAYQADLDRKYAKIWAGLSIDRQIPLGFQAAALEQALIAHARALGLEVKVLRQEVPAPVVILPATVGPDQPIPWSEAALLRKVRLKLSFTPIDLGKVETWFQTRDRIGRRLEVQAVSLSGRAARVEATAYAFRTDLALPSRQLPAFDFEALGQAAGLSPGPREDPPRVEEARLRYRQLDQKRPAINEALALRTEAELRDQRYQVFLKVAARCEAQSWLEVLR